MTICSVATVKAMTHRNMNNSNNPTFSKIGSNSIFLAVPPGAFGLLTATISPQDYVRAKNYKKIKQTTNLKVMVKSGMKTNPAKSCMASADVPTTLMANSIAFFLQRHSKKNNRKANPARICNTN